MTRKRRKKHVRIRMKGNREPNGRLSRRNEDRQARQNEGERSIMQTAIEARVRLFGLSEAAARLPESATTIGRMHLRKQISQDQLYAAHWYIEKRNAYHRAVGAVPDTGRMAGPEGNQVGSDYEAFCKATRELWHEITEAISELMQEQRSPNPAAALDIFLVKDVHVQELVGDLRMALNCIHRKFMSGEVKRRRRAA